MTYTLCTVEDVHASLSEIKRVLKPEGQLLFCEHGLAPEEKTAEWQVIVNGQTYNIEKKLKIINVEKFLQK